MCPGKQPLRLPPPLAHWQKAPTVHLLLTPLRPLYERLNHGNGGDSCYRKERKFPVLS